MNFKLTKNKKSSTLGVLSNPSPRACALTFRPYQQDAFDNRENGLEVWLWGRQTGKSFTLAAWAVDRLVMKPGRLVTVLSNSRANGLELNFQAADICARMQHTFEQTTHGFNDAGLPTTESYSGGSLTGLSVTSGYDSYLRRTSLSATTPTAISHSFSYDTASRLQTVSDGAYSSTYTYHPYSRLVSTLTHAQSGTARLTETRRYDFMNRLHDIEARPSGANQLTLGFACQYNQANQRRRATAHDGSFRLYEYDSLGQVKSGKKYWADGTPVAGQQFEYGFDDIGNRRYARSGGDAMGGGLRQEDYTPNELNQYTTRTMPPSADIIGLAAPSASVTVNGSGADYRRGEYFWESLPLSLNASDPLWQSVSVSAGGTPVTGNLLFPPSTQALQYDFDGNLTSDGVWAYHYDAENRLYRMENLTTLFPTTARKKLTFEYDHQGRRIRKSVFPWGSGAYSGTPASETKFFYDGWNLIKETTGSSWKAYMWGLDLSGSEQGAGGVGGLLLFNDSVLGASFAGYDGNGNVVKLIAAADSTTAADYEYSPFGKVIRMSGPVAEANPVRFSSKYQDGETELLYYGYRYYSPALGRWLNRDPIGERGGPNLLSFNINSLVNTVDLNGTTIYARGHFIDYTLGFGAHLSLKIVPLDQCYWGGKDPFIWKDAKGSWYATLGAGPEGGLLVSNFNRRSDLDAVNGGNTKIDTEIVFDTNDVETDSIMISSILVMEKSYGDDLIYRFFPKLNRPNGFNSNSFIAGFLAANPWFSPPPRYDLILSTGGYELYPGFLKPVGWVHFL